MEILQVITFLIKSSYKIVKIHEIHDYFGLDVLVKHMVQFIEFADFS
jgi:hypothetical protein